MEELKNVSIYTRCSRFGKLLVCPKCNEKTRVYNLSWYAIMCYHCKSEVKKYDWLLAKQQKATL